MRHKPGARQKTRTTRLRFLRREHGRRGDTSPSSWRMRACTLRIHMSPTTQPRPTGCTYRALSCLGQTRPRHTPEDVHEAVVDGRQQAALECLHHLLGPCLVGPLQANVVGSVRVDLSRRVCFRRLGESGEEVGKERCSGGGFRATQLGP